jgi:drug/metabolite transporter (DMT)-like permease
MLAGGALLTVAGLLFGEGGRISPEMLTSHALLAWLYLIVFGSIIGFSAFTYLLRVTTPSKVATSAYVNPLVAVALGWALLGESVTPRTLVAAAIIIGGVMLIRWRSEERIANSEEPT